MNRAILPDMVSEIVFALQIILALMSVLHRSSGCSKASPTLLLFCAYPRYYSIEVRQPFNDSLSALATI